MLIAAFGHYFFGISIFLSSMFLILLVLVQRGRGGGLTGALGGPGGQSAFGTKAGDLFTRITVGVAAIWIFLCAAAVFFLGDRGLPVTGVTRSSTVGTAGDADSDAGLGSELDLQSGLGESQTPPAGTPAPGAGTGLNLPPLNLPTEGATDNGSPSDTPAEDADNAASDANDASDNATGDQPSESNSSESNPSESNPSESNETEASDTPQPAGDAAADSEPTATDESAGSDNS